jgi:hypothetical protein
MPYLAILGRQPELGLAELESLLGADAVQPLADAALLHNLPNLNHLGGSIKLARVFRRSSQLQLRASELNIEPVAGKRNFALSLHGIKITPAKLQALALELKRQLPGSWRYVAPPAGQLAATSVQLTHNQIPARGFELIVARHGQEYIYAFTEQVQDFESYSRRDYDKPARDARVGMLPPKLAQILINLSGPDPLPVWDPFCGTGTVVAEALLMQREAFGSDLEPAMVAASQRNLEWLAQTQKLPAFKVWPANAIEAEAPQPGCAVVTEGFLGAPGRPASRSELAELDSLYRRTLINLHRQLIERIVICVPSARNRPLLPIIDHLTDVGYTLAQFAHAPAERLIYHRPGQIVGRQILSLRKR